MAFNALDNLNFVWKTPKGLKEICPKLAEILGLPVDQLPLIRNRVFWFAIFGTLTCCKKRKELYKLATTYGSSVRSKWWCCSRHRQDAKQTSDRESVIPEKR